VAVEARAEGRASIAGRYRALLWLISLAYVAFGLVTAVIGVVISRFEATYGVPLWVAAALPFAFYLAYGLGSIPFGLLVDRSGARTVLLLGMLLMTLGCFLFYASASWWLTILMVFLIGVGVTAIQTAGNPVIRELDAPARYSGNLTTIVGIGSLGYAVSPVMVPFLEVKGYSWQAVYLVFGAANLALLVALAAVRFPPARPTADEIVRLGTTAQLLRNPVVLTYAIGIFLYVGGEVGVSSYIVSYMEKVHGVGLQDSLWARGSFWYGAFPSASALTVAAFWALQAVGRLVVGPLMAVVRPKAIFVACSGLCVASLLLALMASTPVALAALALTGLFTCASFTLIFSAVIQSFDSNHGTISGILCTAIIGGALVGGLVGVVGDRWGMRAGMSLNLLAFLYVFLLAVRGRGRLDFEGSAAAG
jgi:FHS family L-fucose permease-like MFS transporter